MELRVVVVLFAERAEIVEYCLKPRGRRWAKKHLSMGLGRESTNAPFWQDWWQIVEVCVGEQHIVVPVFANRYLRDGQFPIIPKIESVRMMPPMSAGYAARAFAHAALHDGELALVKDDNLGLASVSAVMGGLSLNPPDKKQVKVEKHSLGSRDTHVVHVEARGLDLAMHKLGVADLAQKKLVCAGRDASASESGGISVRKLGDQERLRHWQAPYLGAAAYGLYRYRLNKEESRQTRLPYFDSVFGAAMELPVFEES